jgi:hypothetical protein
MLVTTRPKPPHEWHALPFYMRLEIIDGKRNRGGREYRGRGRGGRGGGGGGRLVLPSG